MKARSLAVLGAIAAVSCLPAKLAAAETSLCAPGERIIFSCRLHETRKIVSLCASAKLSPSAGYLQYRFGVPGRIELGYPSDQARLKGRIGLVRTQFTRSAAYGVAFTSKGDDYSLSYVASGPDPKDDSYELSVTTAKSDTSLFSDVCDNDGIQGKASLYPLEPLARKLGLAVLERSEE